MQALIHKHWKCFLQTLTIKDDNSERIYFMRDETAGTFLLIHPTWKERTAPLENRRWGGKRQEDQENEARSDSNRKYSPVFTTLSKAASWLVSRDTPSSQAEHGSSVSGCVTPCYRTRQDTVLSTSTLSTSVTGLLITEQAKAPRPLTADRFLLRTWRKREVSTQESVNPGIAQRL